jgi:hypothetical protein
MKWINCFFGRICQFVCLFFVNHAICLYNHQDREWWFIHK